MGALSSTLLLFISLLMIIDHGKGAIIGECPTFCVCIRSPQLSKASCSGQGLFSVHAGVPAHVQALDLSNNSINQLQDRQLSRAGLTRLKFLNLSFNAINEMSQGAFDDLKNLTELDLSYNRIDFIYLDTFYYNEKLRVLRLAGNKFNMQFSPFRSLSLVELDLRECRINHLSKESFQGLPELRKLDLSGNTMRHLDREVFSVLPYLRNLSLGRNYWSCDSMMLSLKYYFRSRNLQTDLFCEKPLLTAQFEKIIGLQNIDPESETLPSFKSEIPMNEKDRWDLDQSWFEDTVRQDENSDSSPSNLFPLTTLSPFWYLLVGFLLGSGATMVITYLGLSTSMSCFVPRRSRAESNDSTDASSQRVSLLRHLYQQDSMNNSDENGSNANLGVNSAAIPSNGISSISPSCPGTPPPPYREVMLHRNLYPRAVLPGRLLDYTSQTTDPATILRRDYSIGATF